MAPRKKTPNMIWVVKKSQQPENIAKPATQETNKSLLDCSPLLEELPQSSNSVAEKPATKEQTLSKLDWSRLPEELLHIISENLEDCFDVIHARSVCQPWRSIFPFPSCLLGTSYSLPSFSKFPRKSKGFCTLEKFPMFLFRVLAPAVGLPSEFFVGGINRDKSVKALPSPFQCSVKVNIPDSESTLLNVLDCQILPLGFQYRMIGWDPQSLATSFRGVASLPLGEGEFVVLIGYSHNMLVLRSADMRWMRLEKTSRADCKDIVTFRGKFYAVFINGDVFVIDPYTLEATLLMPSERLNSQNYLVPSGDDELFLVEMIIVRGSVIDFSKLACRVSRLDEEAGEWVVVNDLGGRVLLIGQPGNSSCSAKELPDGCGVSENSMLFTNEPFGSTYSYKYGVDTGNAEDDLNFWRFSREKRVKIFRTSPMVAHLCVEHKNL
ncbi:PREDICTED: F-box/kelch-repeat protein At1g64840-like [Camelina sativa]|uniref:F-box/kelch-repeat protein At1g64840-like n=1 Tax=Camelina sativa TaxID=90675 RepID=A0ABM0TPT8_CAMSA|nr:PREDICTED: F-box/kelch-repeat protein At1g64840-like [Camelina sativa]